jgi:hypothetical protein
MTALLLNAFFLTYSILTCASAILFFLSKRIQFHHQDLSGLCLTKKRKSHSWSLKAQSTHL